MNVEFQDAVNILHNFVGGSPEVLDAFRHVLSRIAVLEAACSGWMEKADEYRSELHGIMIERRDLQHELNEYKAERILLQQEIRSLRHLDPGE